MRFLKWLFVSRENESRQAELCAWLARQEMRFESLEAKVKKIDGNKGNSIGDLRLKVADVSIRLEQALEDISEHNEELDKAMVVVKELAEKAESREENMIASCRRLFNEAVNRTVS